MARSFDMDIVFIEGGDSPSTVGFAGSLPNTYFVDLGQTVPCVDANGRADRTGECQGGTRALPSNYVAIPFEVEAPAYLAGVLAASLSNHYWNPRYHKEDTRGAVAHIRQHARDGDAIIVTAPHAARALRYYELGLDVHLYPRADRDVSVVDTPALVLRRVSGQRARVWVLESRTFGSIPGADLLPFVRTAYGTSREFSSSGIEVALVTPPSP